MTALVIGAGGAIGRACAERLVVAGLEVVAADVKLVEIPGTKTATVDVTDLASVQRLVSELESQEPITSLVYAAGVNFSAMVDKTDWAEYQKLMAINLQGAFHVSAALQSAARVRARNFSCVYIASTAGLKGEAGGSVYVATKFGLIGFVQSFAAEIASIGGRANSVCPGNVDSPMLRKLAETIAERSATNELDILEQLAKESGFNRLISPEEVANTCSWLVSSESSGISGQTIVVDGPIA